MKATIIGVTRIEGISNKSGVLRPYDMPRILALQQIEISSKSDEKVGTRYSKTGFGFETMEIDLEPSGMQDFAGLKYPAQVDLIIGQKMLYGRLASVCTGIVKPA